MVSFKRNKTGCRATSPYWEGRGACLLKPGQLGLCIDQALGRDLGAMNLKPDMGQGTPLLGIPDQ